MIYRIYRDKPCERRVFPKSFRLLFFFLSEILTELTVLLDVVVSLFKPDAAQRMGHQPEGFLSLNPSPVVGLFLGHCSSTSPLILYLPFPIHSNFEICQRIQEFSLLVSGGSPLANFMVPPVTKGHVSVTPERFCRLLCPLKLCC